MDMRPPLHPKTWATWLGVGVLAVVARLPLSFRKKLASRAARSQLSKINSTNRAVDVNIEACFPSLSFTELRALHRRYLEVNLNAMMLLPRNWWGSEQTILDTREFHDRHHLDNAVESGRPVVLLITHSAGLDAGLLALSPEYELQGIYKPQKNPVLDYLVYRARHRFNAKPLPRGSGFRQLIKGMGGGKIMCYLSDEDLGPEGAVFAPFFGCTKATLGMLPRIVKKTNAIVVPMVAHHNADTDHVHVHFFEPLADYPSDDAMEDATRMNQAIQKTIELDAAQFIWKLRIFQTCPDGGENRYGQIERNEIGVEEL